jgi:uncharacterized protein YjbJ (UPF0337 family)
MGMPNRQEVKGKYEEAVGAVKEKVGHVIDDKEMERQGAGERHAGNVSNKVGKVKRKVGQAIEDVGKFVRKERWPSVVSNLIYSLLRREELRVTALPGNQAPRLDRCEPLFSMA